MELKFNRNRHGVIDQGGLIVGFDYYVDSVNGNDSNTGLTSTLAVKTLAHATSIAGASKRVGLAKGSLFRETLTIPASGMTFGAYGSGAIPIITGANAIGSFTNVPATNIPGSLTKTWSTWNSGVVGENLVDGGQSSQIVYSRDATDSAAKFVNTYASAGTNGEIAREVTGDTWEAWGVPAGATVTSVQLTGWAKKQVANTALTSQSWGISIVNSSGTKIHGSTSNLVTSGTLPTTIDAGYVSGAAGSTVAVDSAYQASTTVVRLQLTVTQTTTASASADVRFNDVAILIMYTVPTTNNNVWDATVSTKPNVVIVSGLTAIAPSTSRGACVTPGNWYYTGTTLTVYATSDPSGNVEAGQRSDAIDTNSQNNLTFKNLTITGANADVAGLFVHIGATSGLLVDTCNIVNNYGSGVRFVATSSGATIRSCTITGNGTYGIYHAAGNNTNQSITDNVIANNGWRSDGDGYYGSGWNGPILSGEIARNTVYNNGIAASGGRGHGLYADICDNSTLTIHHNVCYGNTNGAGIRCRSSAAIYANTCYSNGYSGISANGNTGYNATYLLHHNLVYGNGGAGVLVSGLSGFTVNLQGYNNTLYNNQPDHEGELNVTSDLVGALDWRNNIVYSTGSAGRYCQIATQSGVVTVDYNDYAGSTDPSPFQLNGANYSFANYKTTLSADAHGVNADPLFTAPTATPPDFSLQSGSPARNAGVAISGITDGFMLDMGAILRTN